MEIINLYEPEITFSDLKPGDTFMLPRGKKIHLKIHFDHHDIRAVCLESGKCFIVEDNRQVIPIPTKLFIIKSIPRLKEIIGDKLLNKASELIKQTIENL